ncbi:MAG: hypothetical protein MJ200_04830 [Mycoplasmoidaceae bacterium]|nr:hypothetical protein [Mycoplasmoidaceae bacterium]
MKKLHVLIPSLVATFSMPLIGLVGCGKKEVPPKPDVIYTLGQFVIQSELAAGLVQTNIAFQQGKTYKIVINFNFAEPE